MKEQNIIRSAALAYLAQHVHLLPDAVDTLTLAERFADLVEDQERQQIDVSTPVSHPPLLWLALAGAPGAESGNG